ncbi:hypothetical protein LTS15_007801 [Exophiala xenobiotica]|nr:hypothetical protein LTS15_007801 [Exophiala xenobiotica]
MGSYRLPARGPWMAATFAKRNLVFACFLITLSGVISTYFYHEPIARNVASLSRRPGFSPMGKSDNLGDIFNDTLGFQKVYAISLPERTDKRDTMLLQAQLTNFTLEMVDGVVGSKVSPKALPYTMKQDNGTIGCWRAHLDIFNKMIEENIQSALILEDDADWDVSLKAQMTEFAQGSRYLLDQRDRTPFSPYGDGWDILWYGHCYSKPDTKDGRYWVIPHDPTVAPQGSRWYFEGPDMRRWENGTEPDPQPRVVYKQIYGWCTSGYAVTLRAAQRILWYSSMIPYNWSIDGGMGNMCGRGEFHDFTCIAPFPRTIGKATPAGSKNRGSDIGNYEPDKIQREAESENVMFSVRQNIQRLLEGEKTFKSFFPNPSGDELTMEQITNVKGYPDYVEPPKKKDKSQ